MKISLQNKSELYNYHLGNLPLSKRVTALCLHVAACHPNCDKCTGPGSNKCKECKDGFKEDDKGFCKGSVSTLPSVS